MKTEEQAQCLRECARLCNDFAWTVDTGAYDSFIALFAPDGVFERPGLVSRGHAAIRSFLDARPTDRVTRHVCSNIRIDMTGPGTAKGTSSALMFAAPATQAATLPLPGGGPMVVDYTDDYVLTDDGWKIKHRKTMLVFQA